MGGKGVTAEVRDGVGIVRVLGELDLANVPVLHDACTAFDGMPVVVDLSGCDFIDSSGIAALVQAWHDVDSRGGRRFALASATGQVKRVLKSAGFYGHVEVFRSVNTATVALQPR
jgi:anti-sigma B factor antagonist